MWTSFDELRFRESAIAAGPEVAAKLEPLPKGHRVAQLLAQSTAYRGEERRSAFSRAARERVQGLIAFEPS